MLKTWLILLKYRFFAFQNSLEELQARKITFLKLYHSEDHLQFMSGLVLGQQSPQFSYLADFANAGMLHVLVASGFNISLVAGLAWWATNKIGRKIRLVAVLFAIWFYTAFLKFEPPLMRAAGMFTLAFFLKYKGFRTKRSRILLLTVLMILLVSPGLIDSLSFWLSAAATLGIMVFARRMFMFWRDNSSSVKAIFLEEASTSLAAQSLVFPLLVWYFHQLNLVSFLANPVMLPWLGAITQASALEFLLAFLDHTWWGRVLIAVFSQVTGFVFDLYFAAIAWWQQLFFLNRATTSSSRLIIPVWLLGLGVFWLISRRKPERKSHFFHEKL
mgnify:CR=1 FL=1